MMADAVCNLHTGLQGNGKTLLTLAHVEALRKSSGRKVFYSGIRGVVPHDDGVDRVDLEDWELFGGKSSDPLKPWNTDASKWFDMPTGSIIVIDEAQRLFRPRGNGSAVPPYEAALETLRHSGHTLFLITQQPRLVSTHVRSLCGVHRHMMRKFGSQWVTIHEWAGVKDNCDKTRKDSISSQQTYPKAFYKVYQSAEVHTVKFGLPLKVKLALLLPVALLALIWYFFWGREWLRTPAPSPAKTTAPVQASAGVPSAASGTSGRNGFRAPQSAQATLVSFQPRIPGLPFTAPRYDELTAPVRVPVVVGCWMQGQEGGFCITQQGSRVMMPREYMATFIERGAFVDFEPGKPLAEPPAAQAQAPKQNTLGSSGS